jgi:formylglycine-generating enzyme required for sulfatase activity
VLRDLRNELLFERILLAETWWQRAKVNELRGRLTWSDRDHRWLGRLDAPATLTVEVMPREAQVVLDRYEDDHGRRRPSTVEGWSGRAVRMLAPGSYRLRITAPGRAAAWLPVLLERGEARSLPIELPLAETVPEGFIYVPPGRFLFGSDDDDDLRKNFFHASPQHPAEMAGYLIGRTEVTVGDYIRYLRSLPPAERAMRMPVGGNSNAKVQLEERPGGDWRFTIAIQKQAQSARLGESVRYLGRKRREVQDWRRFPVAGITVEDARAYLAWLDRTGQLPGARLCNDYEWERAARGADDRKFPHGDVLAPDDADFDETYERESYGPDEVGTHPASASPFGVEDLAGNVFEWVASAQNLGDAVLRGGAWWDAWITSRSVNREISQADVRDPVIGLRVCAPLARRGVGGNQTQP